jgi:hypothetical protein
VTPHKHSQCSSSLCAVSTPSARKFQATRAWYANATTAVTWQLMFRRATLGSHSVGLYGFFLPFRLHRQLTIIAAFDSLVNLWLYRCRMPNLQLPSASGEPSRRQGHGKRRSTTATALWPSTGCASRPTTYAIRLRRYHENFQSRSPRTQANLHDSTIYISTLPCLVLIMFKEAIQPGV